MDLKTLWLLTLSMTTPQYITSAPQENRTQTREAHDSNFTSDDNETIEVGVVPGDKGITCAPLEDPEHGYYRCVETRHGRKCQLKCDEGYAVPLTDYIPGQVIHLPERGIYSCRDVGGGKAWFPPLFYDCIEKKYPKYMIFFFSFVMFPTETCKNESEEYFAYDLRYDANNGPVIVNVCEDTIHTDACDWDVRAVCTDDKWDVDAVLSIPFGTKLLENLEFVTLKVHDLMKRDEILDLQVNKTRKREMTRNITFFECPEGSRIENDKTCRGCSKGYHMDMAIMECLPCPMGQYQNLDHQTHCKYCPETTHSDETAVDELFTCFQQSEFGRHTSPSTLIAALGSIVFVFSVFLACRSQIRNEPDGKKREGYPGEEETSDAAALERQTTLKIKTLVPEIGSEDTKSLTEYMGSGDIVRTLIRKKALVIAGYDDGVDDTSYDQVYEERDKGDEDSEEYLEEDDAETLIPEGSLPSSPMRMRPLRRTRASEASTFQQRAELSRRRNTSMEVTFQSKSQTNHNEAD